MKVNNKMKTVGLLGAAMLLGVTSCSDDHFDIVPGTVSGSQSLWENIQSSGVTDSLALILERTIVMRNEEDKTSKSETEVFTYDKFLAQPQTYTVWAPKDGSYNAAYYLDLLSQRDALFAQSEDREAWRLNYKVANQFVLNHIARFNYEAVQSRQKVRMLNSKVSYYEASAQEFNNIALDAQYASVNSSNGTMHVLGGISPFAYNIYDYIAADNSLTKLWGVVSNPNIDKREIYEDGSVQGAINENGDMVYVDTMYITTNEYLDGSGALVRAEDSCYVAILPSDAAWEQAYERVSSLFNYGKTYNLQWSKDRDDFLKKNDDAATLTEDSIASLRKYNTEKLLVQSSFFTSSRFPISDQQDSAQVVNYAMTADSLISTNGTIYYNPQRGSVNPNYNGQTPVKASNGYIFAVDDYKIDPAYTWISRRDISLASDYFVAGATGVRSIGTSDEIGTRVTLTDITRNDSVKGEIEDDTYRRFEVRGSDDMTVDIRLDNMYSTKYKISAVMVPGNTAKAYTQYTTDKKTGETVEVVERPRFRCEIRSDERAAVGSGAAIAQSATFTVEPDTVQTFVLFEAVEIPKCYVGLALNSEDTPFPILRFTMRSMQRGNANSLNISKVIIEPVREEEVSEEE